MSVALQRWISACVIHSSPNLLGFATGLLPIRLVGLSTKGFEFVWVNGSGLLQAPPERNRYVTWYGKGGGVVI